MKKVSMILLILILVISLLSACNHRMSTNQTQVLPNYDSNIVSPDTTLVDIVPEPMAVLKSTPDVDSESSFQVDFIDVGQADAALVRCDGHNMLIDGGNRDDSNLLYAYMQKNNVSHLDYVIGTHAHEDHIGGIPGALQYATVDTVYCPVTEYDSKAFENFANSVKERNAKISTPSEGDIFNLGSATVQVLACHPEAETNNSSIVLKISYGNTQFLFTGDAEYETEKAIIYDDWDLKSTVLKVGHHGSSTSTSYEFLKEVNPEYAVISCGTNNDYGHPHEETLSKLRDAEVKVYRTDLQGDIICTSDGKTVEFKVSRNADIDTIGLEPNSVQKAEQTTKGQKTQTYILNTNSKKIHLPGCSAVEKISENNKQEYTGTKNELISQGYEACGICKP